MAPLIYTTNMPQDKDLERLIRAAERAGCVIRSGKHYRGVFTPDGKTLIGRAPHTPGKGGATKRLRKALAKHGIEV